MSQVFNGRSKSVDPVALVASQLNSQRGHLEYLCESQLPEGVSLEALLQRLRGVTLDAMNRDERLALAMAAVEVCFEQEESAGFIVPFMRRLGAANESECKREWDDAVGPAVRSAILDWAGSIPEFRWTYVGPVRVHAGIPRLLIPRFARMLFEVACEHGLEAISSLPRKELRSAIDAAFDGTRFASEFLYSESGQDLARGAGAVIARAGWPSRRDIAESLSHEPGFHKGFLEQVVRELSQLLDQGIRTPKRGVPRSLWPSLVVLEQAGRVALKFPGLVGAHRCRYSWDQSGSGLGLVRPVMHLGRSVRYQEVFTGDVMLGDFEGAWSIRAWPRRNSAWAAFDLQGKLVGSQGETASIPAGEYLFALPDDVAAGIVAAAGLTLRANLGLLDFDGASVGDFALVHLVLETGCQAIGDLSIDASSMIPRLSCSLSHPLYGSASTVDAVLAPNDAYVLVSGWSDDRSGQFRIIWEIDGVAKDVTAQLCAGAAGHRLSLPQRPHAGVVRVEGRGRRSGSQKSESTLSYVVWPVTSLNKSPGVLGSEESGIVTVQSRAPLKILDMEGNLKTGPIEVAPPGEEARFILEHLDLCLEVCARIPRGRITSPKWIGTPVFVDRAEIEAAARATSVDRLGDFVLHVAPGYGWSLRLRSNEGAYTLFQVSDYEAEKRGISRYPLRWSQVVDSLRDSHAPVSALELDQCGRTLPLNAFVLDCGLLHSPGKHGELLMDAPSDLLEMLRDLDALQAGKAPSGAKATVPCDVLQQIVDAWKTCARVVFGVESQLDGRALRLARIMQRSQSRLRPHEAARLLEQLAQMDPAETLAECGVERRLWPSEWAARFSEAKRALSAAADLTGMMRALRAAIVGGAPPPDAEIPDGLLNGLREYHTVFSTRARDEQAGRSASALRQLRAAEQSGVEPWSEVARAFYLLTLLRRAHVTKYLAEYRDSPSQLALPTCLTQIADSLQGVSVLSRSPECPWCLSDVSPLEDDATLAAGTAPGSNGTWLSLWLSWRRSARDGAANAPEMLRCAQELAGEIPGTLQDRDRIVSELELGKLVEWQ